jgi:hypothetical protein
LGFYVLCGFSIFFYGQIALTADSAEEMQHAQCTKPETAPRRWIHADAAFSRTGCIKGDVAVVCSCRSKFNDKHASPSNAGDFEAMTCAQKCKTFLLQCCSCTQNNSFYTPRISNMSIELKKGQYSETNFIFGHQSTWRDNYSPFHLNSAF